MWHFFDKPLIPIDTVTTVSSIHEQTLRISIESFGYLFCLSGQSLAKVCLGKLLKLVGTEHRNL